MMGIAQGMVTVILPIFMTLERSTLLFVMTGGMCNLLEFLTVEENVRMPMQLFDVLYPILRRVSAQQILELVGLGKYLQAYPDRLSHGQCQRVAIARALVNYPHSGRSNLATGIAIPIVVQNGRMRWRSSRLVVKILCCPVVRGYRVA
jgi:ABC-type histidine transport system ATPase subunit